MILQTGKIAQGRNQHVETINSSFGTEYIIQIILIDTLKNELPSGTSVVSKFAYFEAQ